MQRLRSFPPGARRKNSVPFLMQIFRPQKDEVEIPLNRQMLKAVIQDKQVRSEVLPSPSAGPGAVCIHQNRRPGGAGKHEGFVPGLLDRTVGPDLIGAGCWFGFIPPAQEQGGQVLLKAPVQQPFAERGFAAAAPADVAHGDGWTRRAPGSTPVPGIAPGPQAHQPGIGGGQGKQAAMEAFQSIQESIRLRSAPPLAG